MSSGIKNNISFLIRASTENAMEKSEQADSLGGGNITFYNT